MAIDFGSIPTPQLIVPPYGVGDDGPIRITGTTSPAGFTLACKITNMESATPLSPVPVAAAVGSLAPYAIDVAITAAITTALGAGTYLVWVRRTDVGFVAWLAVLKIVIYAGP